MFMASDSTDVAFQSTLPTRGATDKKERLITAEAISIHAPHTGSDEYNPIENYDRTEFQSTLPTRGATGNRTQQPLM